jgi:hypothetical protein
MRINPFIRDVIIFVSALFLACASGGIADLIFC